MNTNLFKFWTFLLVASLLTAGSVHAQSHKKMDSILKAANNEIYANPDHVIKIGKQIIKDAGQNVDYKIKGFKLISDAYSSKRDYAKSVEYLLKASELIDLSNNQLLKIKMVNKTGIQYHQLKVYDKAIQYLDQAEQLIAEYPHKDSIHMELGKNYVVRGFIYKEKLSCAIAINYIDRGIAELMKVKDKAESASKISIAVYNKGNCYLLMKNNKLALENFQQSAQIAKEVNAKSLEAFALKGSAKVYTLDAKNNEAIMALNKALELSSEVNDLILNQEIYKGLAENYLALNQWDQFRIYQSKFVEIQKQIKDTERISVSESLGVKESEQKVKKEEIAKKFYYLILFLTLILILIILFFYIIIKRKSKEIETIKSQIHALQNQKGKAS